MKNCFDQNKCTLITHNKSGSSRLKINDDTRAIFELQLNLRGVDLFIQNIKQPLPLNSIL